MDRNELLAELKADEEAGVGEERCGCGEPLGIHHDEIPPYTIGGKPVCPDCWFDSLGEEIENHPIVSPFLLARFARPL